MTDQISPTQDSTQVAAHSEPPLASATFTEREPYEKGFADFFEKNLKDRLLKAEKERIELYAIYRKNKPWGIVGYIGLALLAIFLIAIFGTPQLPIFLCIGLGGLLHRWIEGPVRQYRTLVKESIVSEIVKFFGVLEFSESKKIDSDILINSGIIPDYDSYIGGDHLSGNYKSVDMEMCEVTLKRRGGKNNSEYTIFAGEMFNIKMKKPFKGKTVVKKDEGFLGNKFGSLFNKLEHVKLEDPKFEAEFEVYSSDQVEARYLLTTAFMERLLTLRDDFNKNGTVQCEFGNDHLFITITTRDDLFEAGPISESCLDTEDIHTFLRQINSIFQVIEVLKLNQYTGL